MQVELRRVRPDWSHPTDERGRPVALMAPDAETMRQRIVLSEALWSAGLHPAFRGVGPDSYAHEASGYGEMAEVDAGDLPGPRMPAWPAGEATAFQWYEQVSEGTPLSPVLSDESELWDWSLEATGRDGEPLFDRDDLDRLLARCLLRSARGAAEIRRRFGELGELDPEEVAPFLTHEVLYRDRLDLIVAFGDAEWVRTLDSMRLEDRPYWFVLRHACTRGVLAPFRTDPPTGPTR